MRVSYKKRLKRFTTTALFFAILMCSASAAYAQSADAPSVSATSTLQKQVDDTNAKIAQLQQEINQLQSQLTTTAAQKQTLKNAVAALNINIQKLQKSISLTKAQIGQKDQQISLLSTTISTTSNAIQTTQIEVADSLRQLNSLDDEPLILAVFQHGTLSSFFDQATALQTLRSQLDDKILRLSALKRNLQSVKSTAQNKRDELTSLQTGLSQKKQGLAVTLDTQSQLLTETKNKESTYQTLLAQKKAQEAAFESDLQDFESKLHLQVSAGSVPAAGSGVLQWPLESIRVTQYFGNTPFATKNPQLYSGHGHTGVDFAASPGTPVMAARAGVVLGTGNTDATCPGASYGKWVFIKHDNGLDTLYAHLSVISTSQGREVKAGDVIGYSGSTGYATGPHLHFGVYASTGAEIASFASKSCKNRVYTMPVGDISAYLNPLSYLPALP